MYNQLYKLFSNNSRKKPLEDFTTELFAGVLQSHDDICVQFCNSFLEIEGGNFNVSTQVYYPSLEEDSMNCFVDLVIENVDSICFIENKVHSSEGFEQLERYAKVLESFQERSIHLKYCTKHTDPKPDIHSKFGISHNFSQFQWHRVSAFLLPFIEYPAVKHFIHFLENHNMHIDMKLSPSDLIAMENVNRITSWTEKIIDNELADFARYFGKFETRSKHQKYSEIETHSRASAYIKGVISPIEKYSEILYSIEMKGFAVVQIYVNRDHPKFKEFHEFANEFSDDQFRSESLDFGTKFFAQKNLAQMINNENIERELHVWFSERFKTVLKFIRESQKPDQLEWVPELVEKANHQKLEMDEKNE